MYALGLDLGTTFTAAAVWRDGHAEIVPLGSRTAAVPSVVLLREDGTFLTGEAAHRRALLEPHRVAREFKRRLGDSTPFLLGGVPQTAEALTAELIRAVLGQVTELSGAPPAATCVTYPATWGRYKIDLMRQAVDQAGLTGPVLWTTEPEAAAASSHGVEPGATLAVYDLGGGTFDAAVLRRTGVRFEILGRPEGIERLGGADFDAAVLQHVRVALGGKLEELDEDDPAAITAVARLRDECVQAKEALSADTDTTIPVLLPGTVTEVRLTRSELEEMVRPALHGSIEALRRAVRSADTSPEELHSVLLVGGSSRMPVVAQLVSSELGCPVAVDAHPKHAVALGAATLAGAQVSEPAAPVPASGRATAPSPVTRKIKPAVVAAGVASVPSLASSPVSPSAAARPSVPTPATRAPTPPAPETIKPPRRFAARRSPAEPSAAPPPTLGGKPSEHAAAQAGARRTRRRRLLVAAGAAIAVLAVAGGIAYAQYDRDNRGTPAGTAAGLAPGASPSTAEAATGPADEQCTDELKSNRRWVCITKATIADGTFTVEYDTDFGGSDPDATGGFHLHLFGSEGDDPPDDLMGAQAPESRRGAYYDEARTKSVLDTGSGRFTRTIADAPKVCARIARADHTLVRDAAGTYTTGNCLPIDRR
ncbi:Hsp70 family protein [Symbioplanes lichenis]|uniref:Hsp70 family protein n=1 Tax=Symbioplanes lichenis TaxID=1629072 RepID=UPI00273971F1|nr:Hsp70 family protein [Actinoplanes lichenis]